MARARCRTIERAATLVLSTVAGLVLSGDAPAIQAQETEPSSQASQDQALPVSYVCPMAEDADVLEDHPGKCPVCRMNLVPVIIDLAWSCPVHAAVVRDAPGRCPLDKRELVKVAVSKYWICDDTPREHLTEPGVCADGSPRTLVREPRAHGDHNPKHGGQLFMASDKWHHIEASYPEPGVVHVFVYDNFTQPMGVADFSGRAIVDASADVSAGTAQDAEAFSLMASSDDTHLEAKIGNRPLPVRVTIKFQFEKTDPEERFDFVFQELSEDVSVASPSVR